MVLLSFPPRKPSSALISEGMIRQAVHAHPVTIVVSAKGTGKSTLVPSALAGMATVWWTVPFAWQTDSIAEAVHMNTKLPVGFEADEEGVEYAIFTHELLLKNLIDRRSKDFDWNLYGSLVIGIDDADCMAPKHLPIITALAEYISRCFLDIRIIFTCKDLEFGKALCEYLTPRKVVGPERPITADSQLSTWKPAFFSFKSAEPNYKVEEMLIKDGMDIVGEYIERASPDTLLVLPGIDYLPMLLKKLPECLFYGSEEDPELRPDNRILKESTKPVVCIWDFYRLAPIPERITKVIIPNKLLLKEYIPSKNIYKLHLTDTLRTCLAKPILTMQYFLGELPEERDLCFFTHTTEDISRALYKLRCLQAIDAKGSLTEKGKRMVELGHELPFIEIAALLVETGCCEMAAATVYDFGSGRTKRSDSMQSSLGDLHTWMNYLCGYQGSRSWCTSHCLNQSNLEKAKALAHELGKYSFPKKPLKDAIGKMVIEEAIEKCLNVAEYRNGGYFSEEGVELWIHPKSVLFRKSPPPQRVAYLEACSRHVMPTIPGLEKLEQSCYEEDDEEELYVKDKIFMRGIVSLSKM